MDPFGSNSDLKEDIIPKEKNRFSCPSKKEWLIIIISLSIITVAGIFLIIYLASHSSNKKDDLEYSEISCLYIIVDFSNSIQLLGEEFENIDNSILNIIINETKIDYTKNYTFQK